MEKRAYTVDLLRGLAIVGMVLSGQILWHAELPAWLFHAQVPPPSFRFDPSVPGITWVDLVFPFFLFSMGAAFPLALRRRLEQRGESVALILTVVARRWALLALFAIALANLRSGVTGTLPGWGSSLLQLAGWGCFCALFMRFGRLSDRQNRMVCLSGVAGIAALLAAARWGWGLPVSAERSDVIILVLANMALFGSLVWLYTRNNLLARLGVLALLADSTNAERPGFTATEQTVAEGVRRLFAKAGKRRIIVATFASNIYRVQQIIDLAIESGRKVAVSGRSMVSNTEMARELGYLHAPDNVLITIDEINKYPPEKVVLITTGSQGEPLSALSRMAQASHRQVRVGPNDFIIISARPIPGNEKTVTKVVNGLLTLGAEVIYENMYDTHVSGHACQEEQKLMLTLAHPQFFLPVHGEFKQLKRHAETAEHLGYIPKQNIYIAENGQNIRLSADGMTVENTVTAGAVMVDGYGVGDVGNVVLRDRHHLSEDGIIIVTAAIDGSNGQVLSGPDLVSRGFVYVRESEELMEGARTQVEMALDRSLADNLHDWASVKARVREALSSYIYRRTKRSPMILPILLEV